MRSRQSERTSRRIALIRHGRGTTAAVAPGFGRLANLALHQETDVARHLPKRSSQHSTSANQRRHLIAMRVRRHRRSRFESKLRIESFSHRYSTVAERSQGSASSAKLQHRCRAESIPYPLLSASNRSQPTGSLQAEGHWWGRLKQSPPEHDAVLVSL